MLKIKRISIISFVLAVFMCFSAFAGTGEWIQTGNNWQYKKNGVILKAKWETIDGTTYYFDKDANMATGLTKIGQYYYMFDKNGVPHEATGKFEINNKIYKITGRGKIEGLEFDINTDWYNNYKDKEKGLTKWKANPQNDALKAALTTQVLGTYNTISADELNNVISSVISGADFMGCFNAMLNEIRMQIRAKEKVCLQALTADVDEAGATAKKAEYEVCVNEYRDLATKILAQIIVAYSPKVGTINAATTKIGTVLDKFISDYGDKLDAKLERLQGRVSSDDDD